MKKTIVILLIFISCTSTKEVNSIRSIDRKVQNIEEKLVSLSKTKTHLSNNFYSTDYQKSAIAYSKKSSILKIEYDITYSPFSVPEQTEENLNEFKRMGYSEEIIRRIGEVYFSNEKPILIKEKITSYPSYSLNAAGINNKGQIQVVPMTFDNNSEFIIYVLDWEKNIINIENIKKSLTQPNSREIIYNNGFFNESDFNQVFYDDIIKKIRKQG